MPSLPCCRHAPRIREQVSPLPTKSTPATCPTTGFSAHVKLPLFRQTRKVNRTFNIQQHSIIALLFRHNMGNVPLDVWERIVSFVAPEDYNALAGTCENMRNLVLRKCKHWTMTSESSVVPWHFVESLTCFALQERDCCVPPNVPFARMPRITQIILKTPVDEVERLVNLRLTPRLRHRLPIHPSKLLEQIRELGKITHLTLPEISRLSMENSPALPDSLKKLNLNFNAPHGAEDEFNYAGFIKWLKREDNKAIVERITFNWNGECPPFYESGPVFKNLRRCLKHVIIDATHLSRKSGYRTHLIRMLKHIQLPNQWAASFGLPNVKRLTLRKFGAHRRTWFELIKKSLGSVQTACSCEFLSALTDDWSTFAIEVGMDVDLVCQCASDMD